MALTTYSELKTAVADWLNRDDLTSVIPTFISLAEASMERVLRTHNMLTQYPTTLSTQYTLLPSDFLEMRSVKLLTSPVTPVEYMGKEQLDEYDSLHSGGSKPLYYTLESGQLRIAIPDGSYSAYLTYYAKLEKLSDTITTNWLLASHPDAYLYGALLQAAPYLKDDARVQIWNGLFAGAIEAIKTADERGATTGGMLKMRAKAFGT